MMSAHTGFFDSSNFQGILPTGLCRIHSPHSGRCRLHMLPLPPFESQPNMAMVMARLKEGLPSSLTIDMISFCKHTEWLQQPNGPTVTSSQAGTERT